MTEETKLAIRNTLRKMQLFRWVYTGVQIVCSIFAILVFIFLVTQIWPAAIAFIVLMIITQIVASVFYSLAHTQYREIKRLIMLETAKLDSYAFRIYMKYEQRLSSYFAQGYILFVPIVMFQIVGLGIVIGLSVRLSWYLTQLNNVMMITKVEVNNQNFDSNTHSSIESNLTNN